MLSDGSRATFSATALHCSSGVRRHPPSSPCWRERSDSSGGGCKEAVEWSWERRALGVCPRPALFLASEGWRAFVCVRARFSASSDLLGKERGRGQDEGRPTGKADLEGACIWPVPERLVSPD